MLVLSRKLGESICIGDSITITLVEIRGQRVRLGIEAPRDVSVLRRELEGGAIPALEAAEGEECLVRPDHVVS